MALQRGGEGGRELIYALSSFIFHILEGNTPVVVQPFLFGAALIALIKKGGDVCPIAVGQTLRRLAAKCTCFRIVESMGATLALWQLEYGIRLGYEAVAHAAQCYLDSMSPGQLLMKLDFRNAFNSLRCAKMLIAVKSAAPDLFRYPLHTGDPPRCSTEITSSNLQEGCNRATVWAHYCFACQSTH